MRACYVALTILMLVSVGPGAALSGEAVTQTRDTVTQYGVTWTFATHVSAGRFVTGDRWWQEENSASPLAKAMWETCRDKADAIGSEVQERTK